MAEETQQVPTWYEANGQYVGPGSLYSTGLNKTIEGTFTVHWDQLGSCDVTCEPTNLDTTDVIRLVDEFDRFADLRVDTPDGVFSCPKLYFNGLTIGSSQSTELRFSLLRGMYTSNSCPPARYWNAPLVNFVSNLLPYRPPLVHPLRLIPPRQNSVEDGLTFHQALLEGETNRLCVFEFGSEPAFIERLPSYEDVKSKLTSKGSQFEVTGMMVGSIPEPATHDLDGILEWFPADAMTALSLGTGNSVGFGFIELRDDSTALHGRIHASFHCDAYEDDPLVVNELAHGGVADSGLRGVVEAFIRADGDTLKRATVLAQTIRTAKSQLTTPDHAFAAIVRGLDGVSNELGLHRRRLLLEVPIQDRDAIRTILLRSRDELNAMAAQMDARGCTAPEGATVRRIASRLEQADAIEDSFGLTLPRLLKHYDLRDEQAIADLYALKPRYDGLSWPEALNKYRGQVIHKGYIDYRSGIPMRDVSSITKHLIDIATRICLLEIGYRGTYNPNNLAAMQVCALDYFQGSREAELFGLSGTMPAMIARVGF